MDASEPEALELYLSSYQLVLRKQCWALIQSKGLPSQLEPLVKDLWGLWLPLLYQKLLRSLKEAKAKTSNNKAGEMYGTEEYDGGEDEMLKSSQTDKNAPMIVDSLALCYMGAMFLRLPLSVGDLYKSGRDSFHCRNANARKVGIKG